MNWATPASPGMRSLYKTEPTAKPTSYIVYQAEGKGGIPTTVAMVRSNIYNVKLGARKLRTSG